MPSIARGLTRRRRDHLGEAGVAGLVHRQVDQRELELRADAGEEVEAAARHLRAALEVDGAEHPAELDVVARLEVELPRRADRLEHDEVVLAPGRRLVGGQVGDRHDRVVPLLLGRDLGGLRVLDLGGQRLGLREQGLLLLALGLRDQLAELLLLGPLGLEGADGGAAGGVGGEGPVHDVGGESPLGLGGAYAVGVVSQDSWVDHVPQPICRSPTRSTSDSHPRG